MSAKNTVFILGFLVLAAGMAAAQGYGNGQGGGAGRGQGGNGYGLGGQGAGEEDLTVLLQSLPKESLTPGESKDLLSLMEEEKLARDVYLFLAAKWNMPVFSNIARSEQSHMDGVQFLVARYGLKDPTKGKKAGEFSDPKYASLYSQLTVRGSKSLQEAFLAGAEIEDLDLKDLEDALKVTDNRDVGVLYQNLAKGSRNHMRSFVAQLERAGGRYTAKYISADYLRAILKINRETAPITEPLYDFRN